MMQTIVQQNQQAFPTAMPLRERYLRQRRIIELFLILIFSPILFLLIGIVCIYMMMTEKAPVFFIQNRPGKNGVMFRLYKFRTMVMHADHGKLTSVNDARITGTGRFLRKFKLDELPQLYNVIKGDMSIIGPRPVPENFYYRYLDQIPDYASRHVIRPGITGLAQVRLGYTETLEQEMEKLKLDLVYLQHVSWQMDLYIVKHTLWSVSKGGFKN